MVNDDATAMNELQCLEACKAEDQCNFWDYGSINPKWRKHCRLRSDDGIGAQISEGFLFGYKNCVPKGIYRRDHEAF